MQTSYTMKDHAKAKDTELAIFCYNENTLRPFEVAHDWDPDSGSQDASLEYKGTRSEILRDAWENMLRGEAIGSAALRKTARNVIAYLFEDPDAPPFVPDRAGAHDTTRRTGDGTIEVWEQAGTIHGLPVICTYEIDPDRYTAEQREQTDFDWESAVTGYRLV